MYFRVALFVCVNHLQQTIMKTLPLVFLLVGIGFLILGGYLLTTDTAMGDSPAWMRMALGGLLIIYGLFRVSTSLGAMKKKTEGGAK